mmetsp:Transcript_20926/g.42466  ORF Transcript_20926/g.42466 Transcript_20926/m.42466 type:complete len:82 (+) Transcript_20926:664-909(+)
MRSSGYCAAWCVARWVESCLSAAVLASSSGEYLDKAYNACLPNTSHLPLNAPASQERSGIGSQLERLADWLAGWLADWLTD